MRATFLLSNGETHVRFSPQKVSALALLVLVAACGSHHAYRVSVSPPRPARFTRSALSRPDGLDGLNDILAFRAAAERQHLLDVAKVTKIAEQDRLRRRVAPTPTGSQTRLGGPVSVNHAPHSDAWWHGVSVCEQGGRNDSFFGYLSIMDGSAGGKPWAEQVQMGNAIIARAGDYAWAVRCVQAGYAASPGG